jgi:hypothetical protein
MAHLPEMAFSRFPLSMLRFSRARMNRSVQD